MVYFIPAVILLLKGFRTYIQIVSDSGESIDIPVIVFQRGKASQFVDHINRVLAEYNQ